MLTAVACGGDDSDNNNTGDGDGDGTGGTISSSGGFTGSGGAGDTGGTTGSGGAAAGGDWIEAADAGVSVGVGVYSYKDTGGSTITLTNPNPGELCVSGTALGHMMTNYSTHWGAGLGFALVSETEKAGGMGYDLTSVTNIEFTLTGTLPAELRIGFAQVDDPDNSFFVTSAMVGANSLAVADLAQGDWVMPPTVKDFTKVTDLQFQVASGAADAPFDFCISGVKLGDLTWGMGGAGTM